MGTYALMHPLAKAKGSGTQCLSMFLQADLSHAQPHIPFTSQWSQTYLGSTLTNKLDHAHANILGFHLNRLINVSLVM
mgnify:FL=1